MCSFKVRLKDTETGYEWITFIHTTNILFEGDEIMVDDRVCRIIKIDVV